MEMEGYKSSCVANWHLFYGTDDSQMEEWSLQMVQGPHITKKTKIWREKKPVKNLKNAIAAEYPMLWFGD